MVLGLPNFPSRPFAQVRPAAAPGRPRAKKGDGDLLRTEILDVAERLLLELGSVQAVSMRSVAKAAGVTPPSIYRHFDDKEQMFFEVCNRRFTEMDVALAKAVIDGSAGERIEALGRAYVEFGLERGEQYQAMFQGLIPDSLSVEEKLELPGSKTLVAVAALIQMGIASEEFKESLHPEAVAIALWSTVHGLVLTLVGSDDAPIEFPEESVVIDQAMEILLAGLRR